MSHPFDAEALDVADRIPLEAPGLQPLDTSTELAKFDPIQYRLNDLQQKISTTVYDIDTKDGEDTARLLRGLCVKVRTDADKAYKILNAPLLAAQRSMRSLVEKIETEVKPLESRLDAEIKAKEQKIEVERQRKIAIEEARIKALRAKITTIAGLPARAVSMDLAELQEASRDLSATAFDEAGFGEFAEEAEALAVAIATQLDGMLVSGQARAAEAERLVAVAQQLNLERQAQALATQRTHAINEIRGQPLAMMGLPSSVMASLIKTAEILEPEVDEFGDMLEEAERAHVLALSQMRSLRDAAWVTERAAADLTIANAQAEQRRQQDAADAERRQRDATAGAKLLKDQQDAFEQEQIEARAKVQAERDALAVEKAAIAEMAAALEAPKSVAPATLEPAALVAQAAEPVLFDSEPFAADTQDAVGATALAAWIVEMVMSEMQVSELDALSMLLDAKVQWDWTERRVELEANLTEIPS